jgi:AbrB family looped-hinge helix DNA binding protein
MILYLGGMKLKKLQLKKTGQIYIPKSFRKVIDLNVGDYINIFLDGKKIVLTNKEDYDKENKCIFSEKGTVHIPTEIRRLSRINPEEVFTVTLDEKEKRIILIPELTG